MNIIFEKMGNKHQKQVMDIFNYYISNGTAAFPGTVLPEQFYRFLMEKSEGYPSYVLKKDNNSKGLGSKCLEKLEQDAIKMGIRNLIAEVSSENKESINFHKKHGFFIAGELKDIGEKFEHSFGVIYMQKRLGDL